MIDKLYKYNLLSIIYKKTISILKKKIIKKKREEIYNLTKIFLPRFFSYGVITVSVVS